eukprot:3700686-Pleurochrysis_carterae.AAC.1
MSDSARKRLGDGASASACKATLFKDVGTSSPSFHLCCTQALTSAARRFAIQFFDSLRPESLLPPSNASFGTLMVGATMSLGLPMESTT